MKKPFFSVPRTLILHALTTFLIGVGCVWPLSLSLGLTAPLEECVVCCGAVTLLFALLDCLPRLRALAYPLLLAGISGVAFAMRGQFAAVGAALALLVHGQPLALAAYSQEITLLLALVFTGIGASLSRSDQAFFPLALLEIALLFVVSFLGASVSAASLLPLILALLLSSRAPGVQARRIVPAVRRRAGCHRAAHAAVFADRAGAGDAGSARPADDRRLPVFHAGTRHVFAEHDRLSAARRFSAGAARPIRRIPR